MTTDVLSVSEPLVDNCRDPSPLTQFTGTEGTYLLPHNEVEIERLQRQHRFIGSATNRKLLQYPLQSGAKVLDSGCADGTYMNFLILRISVYFEIVNKGLSWIDLTSTGARDLAQGSKLSAWKST